MMVTARTTQGPAQPKVAMGLAALALAAAACGAGGAGNGVDGATAAGPTTISVTGTNGLQFEPTDLTARAGSVTIELIAQDVVEHTFVIEELDDVEVVAVAAGETATGTVELDAGTWTFYCSVPGHRGAGMEGELTVTS